MDSALEKLRNLNKRKAELAGSPSGLGLTKRNRPSDQYAEEPSITQVVDSFFTKAKGDQLEPTVLLDQNRFNAAFNADQN
ncbi:MAG: hypothetical protein ACK559_31735, partial [bacterium]